MVKKRYEAVYIHPDFCDGFYDNEEERYLKPEEVNELLNYKLTSDEIEEILNRNGEELIEEEINMSGLGLTLEGIGLVIYGFANLIWVLAKLISCIAVAGYISIRLGLSGYLWWFSSIVIFCILSKIVFYKNSNKLYNKWVENYSDKCEELKEDVE